MERIELYELQFRKLGKNGKGYGDWQTDSYRSGSKSDLRDRMTLQNTEYRIVESREMANDERLGGR